MHKKVSAAFLILLCFVSVVAAQKPEGMWAGAFEPDDVLAASRSEF